MNLLFKTIPILIWCILLDVNAQTVKTSNGEAIFRIEKTISEEAALNKAIENAKINAIENAFGSVITEGNTLYIKDIKSGNQLKSNQIFSSISNVLVNGEWIKTTDEKHSIYEEDGYRWVKVSIEGQVRALTKIPFTPETYTLSCDDKRCKTELFNNGQNMIVYFKAPNDGYVSIYLDDSKQVQRLLPYSNNPTSNSYKVKADQIYYFFSSESNDQNTDQIELFTEENIEQNQLLVLYSKEDFIKPILSKNVSFNNGSENYQMPLSSQFTDFYNWLQKIRSYNRNIELQSSMLTIKK